MKLHNIKELISKTVLVLFSIGILGITGCTGTSNTVTADDLSNKGYAVTEVSDGVFYITENGVDYYFEKSIFENPAFKRVVIKYPANNKYFPLQGIDEEVSIIKEGPNKMTVTRKSPYLKTKDGDEIGYNTYYFELKNNFDTENITNNRGFDDIKGDYQWLIDNCLSPDDLNRYYLRGFELEEEIN